jgi:hypothetical protein
MLPESYSAAVQKAHGVQVTTLGCPDEGSWVDGASSVKNNLEAPQLTRADDPTVGISGVQGKWMKWETMADQ